MIIRWEKDITFYNEIDPELIQDFFVNDIENIEEDIKKTDELLEIEAELIIKTEADLTSEDLTEMFKVIFLGENLLYAYEFFNVIFIMIKKLQIQNVLNFFNEMDTNLKAFFYNIPFSSGYNAFIIKIYLIFIIKFRNQVLSHSVILKNLINLNFEEP